MSRFSYAGVELGYIHTTTIDQEPQYSDDGMDYLYSKITIGVEAIINSALTPSLGGESATQTEARIRHLLSLPRKPLEFLVNADSLITVVPPDAKNGPFPKRHSVKRIGGTQSFLVDFQVETYVVECPAGAPPPYISNRYRETVTVDENFYTKKTRTGKVVVRADVGNNPDGLRTLIAPPIQTGFKRESSEWILQEDGLAMTYTIIDREVYLQPPAPSTKAEGEYTESTTLGAIRFGECRIRLEGAKTSDKGALIELAIVIALTKVRGVNGQLIGVGNQVGSMLQSAAIREHLWENKIEVTIKTMLAASPERKLSLPTKLDRFGSAIPGVTNLPPDPGTRGTAGLLLQAAAFMDPCVQTAILKAGGLAAATALGITNDPVVQVFAANIVPDDASGLYKDDGRGGLYTEYKIMSRVEAPENIVQMPVASSTATETSVFCQVAAAIAKRVVEWSAEKVGSRPILPDPKVNDENAVLLNTIIDVDDVVPDSDGTALRFRVAGRYFYGFKDPNKVNIVAGVPPWVSDEVQSQVAFSSDDFRSGIIDNQVSQPGVHVLHGNG